MPSAAPLGNPQGFSNPSCRAISLGTGTFHFHQSLTEHQESVDNDVVDSITFDNHRKKNLDQSDNSNYTRNHKLKDRYVSNTARGVVCVEEKESMRLKNHRDDSLGLGEIRVIFHPSTSPPYKTCLHLPPIKELNDKKTLEAIINNSISVCVDGSDNTNEINASPMKMNPCLCIRATDLATSLPTSSSIHSSFNDSNTGFYANKQHAHLIKPHPMVHIDNDPNEVFFALNFTCSNSNPTCDKMKHIKKPNHNDCNNITNSKHIIQPSPLLPSMMELLMSEGMDFISNSNYWTYYHTSAIRTCPLPSSSTHANHNMYFPKAFSNHSSLPFNSEPTISAVSLSQEQIKALKEDVLMWTDSKHCNNNANSNSPVSSYHQIHSGTKSNQNIFGLRAYGIIQMKPKQVHDLMLDSGRIKEYHHYALERNDIWSYDHEIYAKIRSSGDECKMNENIGIKKVTKVCHGKNKPPLVRKPIPYETLFHSQEIPVVTSPSSKINDDEERKGYFLVTRTVKEVDANGIMKDMKSYSTEIMLGSTMFLPVEGHDDLTLFINANLVRSSMPNYLLKKVGMSSGVSYVNWIRSISK